MRVQTNLLTLDLRSAQTQVMLLFVHETFRTQEQNDLLYVCKGHHDTGCTSSRCELKHSESKSKTTHCMYAWDIMIKGAQVQDVDWGEGYTQNTRWKWWDQSQNGTHSSHCKLYYARSILYYIILYYMPLYSILYHIAYLVDYTI